MSALVSASSQIVLHPVVSHNLRILSTTNGRDKVYRAAQNLARIIAYLFLVRGNAVSAARWTALKAHLALGRKLLQLGKPVEHLQAALRAYQTAGLASSGEQAMLVLRQLCYFGYLTYDALVWAHAVKFLNFKPVTAQRVNRTSNRFWLAGILLSITHSLLKAGRLANEARALGSAAWAEKDGAGAGSSAFGAAADRAAQARALDAARAATRYQFALDCIDVWLPASALELVGMNDGLVGLCGLVTSVMSLRSQWDALMLKRD